jgi:hypothetical protein
MAGAAAVAPPARAPHRGGGSLRPGPDRPVVVDGAAATSQGKNWARISSTVLFALATLQLIGNHGVVQEECSVRRVVMADTPRARAAVAESAWLVFRWNPEGGRGLDTAAPPGPAVSSCTACNSDWAFQGQLVEAPLSDRFIYGVIES